MNEGRGGGRGGREEGGREGGEGGREGGREWREREGGRGGRKGGRERGARAKLGFPPSLQPSLTASYTFLNFIMYLMIMYSRSVKFSGIASPCRSPSLRNITSSNVER